MESPRSTLAPLVAIGAAWWLLTDLTAVWGPSLITIFGQAAETPAEVMGLFALGCVLTAYAVLLVSRRQPLVALAGAVAARALLAAVPGGQIQLWAASVGVACGLAWLAIVVARNGPSLPGGFALGGLLQVTAAAVGGTWLAVWRVDAVGLGTAVVLLVLLVVTARAALETTDRPTRRQTWTLLPLALVAGVAFVPGRASAVHEVLGPLALVVGWSLACLVTRGSWSRAARAVLGALAVAAVAASLLATATVGGVPGSLPLWLLAALVLGPAGLVSVLQNDAPGRGGAASVVGGGVLWVVLFFAYYAGYDLGYRADLLLVAVAAGLVLWSLPSPATGHPVPMLALAATTGGLLVLALVSAYVHRMPDRTESHDGSALEVVTYNVRMGYGMDGRFDPRAVADVVGDADVVLLQEVDRGWLLNGGQDQLAILARLTGMRAYFAPAADPVWGDAILTSLPVEEVRGHPLESYGAVTGAGVLAVRVEAGDQSWWVVSTHVQPTTTREDGTIDQARDIAAYVEPLASSGRLVLGGDFNLEPGSPSFDALLDAGLSDALADVRPLPTSDSVDPVEQIDHVFVGPGLVASEGRVIETTASDHLPVAVRIELD